MNLEETESSKITNSSFLERVILFFTKASFSSSGSIASLTSCFFSFILTHTFLFLVSNEITATFFLVTGLGLYLSFQYQLAGMALATFVLYLSWFSQGFESSLLVQIGVLSSFSLNFLIAYLIGLEEAESAKKEQKINLEHREKVSALFKLLQEKGENWEQERIKLEEELKKWKDEAEQRKIEKSQQDERILLIESAIALRETEKEHLIAEAQNSRKEAFNLRQAQHRLETSIEEQKKNDTQKIHHLLKQLEDNKLEMESLRHQISKLVAPEKIDELSQALKEEKELYQKILERSQELEEQLAKQVPQEKIEELSQAFEKEKETLLERYNALLQRHQTLEELSQIKEKSEKGDMAQIKGLYGQLKQQFEEKSHVLNSARKELYDLEGKLLAIKKEQEFSVGDDFLEPNKVFKDLNSIIIDYQDLKNEILHLEELISHILIQ